MKHILYTGLALLAAGCQVSTTLPTTSVVKQGNAIYGQQGNIQGSGDHAFQQARPSFIIDKKAQSSASLDHLLQLTHPLAQRGQVVVYSPQDDGKLGMLARLHTRSDKDLVASMYNQMLPQGLDGSHSWSVFGSSNASHTMSGRGELNRLMVACGTNETGEPLTPLYTLRIDKKPTKDSYRLRVYFVPQRETAMYNRTVNDVNRAIDAGILSPAEALGVWWISGSGEFAAGYFAVREVSNGVSALFFYADKETKKNNGIYSGNVVAKPLNAGKSLDAEIMDRLPAEVIAAPCIVDGRHYATVFGSGDLQNVGRLQVKVGKDTTMFGTGKQELPYVEFSEVYGNDMTPMIAGAFIRTIAGGIAGRIIMHETTTETPSSTGGQTGGPGAGLGN